MPTWLASVAVGVLTFPVVFQSPAAGLDASWSAALYLAFQEGFSFGSEIVYTYGPLGFLHAAQLWFDGPAIVAFLWLSLVWFAGAFIVVWALRRNLGLVAAIALGFVTLSLLSSAELELAGAVIGGFALLEKNRPPAATWWLVVGGALFASVEILIKLSIGPVILAIVLLVLVGARARPVHVGVFAAVFIGSTAILWVASGSDLGDLPGYVTNGREIISGYSEALAVPGVDGVDRLLLFGVPLALVIASAFAQYRDGLARVVGIAVMAIAAFAIFKEGAVRADAGHVTTALATMAILWLALPWPATRLGRSVTASGTVVVVVAALVVQSSVDTKRLNPFTTLDNVGTQVDILFSPQRRDEIRAFSRAVLMRDYDIEPAVLSELEGMSVSVDPWETAAVWVYGLEWAPVPIFQGYQAYTAPLDELNADQIASASGPERILRQNPDGFLDYGPGRGVDGRFAGWDPPAQALATLCHFEPLRTTDSWQVLGRVADRCGEPELVESVESAFGERVPVPRAADGSVIFVKIHGAEVSGLERLRTILYRSRFRYAVVDGASYRLVPGTAGDGLLLAGAPELVGEGPWADAPGAETIELTGIDGDLRYDFYAMSVRPSETEKRSRGREG